MRMRDNYVAGAIASSFIIGMLLGVLMMSL